MTAPSNKGKGAGIQFLREHANYAGEACLIWPMRRQEPHGYGALGFNGKLYRAHRLMCEIAHGPAPSKSHHAAHSCGKGHEGCVNPAHLSWKTASENQADSVAHGTTRGPGIPRRKLTAEQVAQIRSLKGQKTQVELAEMFGVRHEAISKIHRGVTWPDRPSKRGRLLDPAERPLLAQRAKELLDTGWTLDSAAREVGVSPRTCRVLAAEAAASIPAPCAHSGPQRT